MSDPMNLLRSIAAKPPMSAKDMIPNSPKYWKVTGSTGLMILNSTAKSGMESVYMTDMLSGYESESMSPIGNRQGVLLKWHQPM